VDSSGRVHVSTGLTSQGQGHQTVFAQIVASELGVPIDDVIVTTGDTRRFGYGGRYFRLARRRDERNAIALASRKVTRQGAAHRGEALEADPRDLEIVAGVGTREGRRVGVDPAAYGRGVVQPAAVPFDEWPAGDAVRRGRLGGRTAAHRRAGLEGKDLLLAAALDFASGMHAGDRGDRPGHRRGAHPAVRGAARLRAAHQPAIVGGQIHGGVAQGVGGALYERMVYDAEGQLLNASFMDFLMPIRDGDPACRDGPYGNGLTAEPAGHQGRRGRPA